MSFELSPQAVIFDIESQIEQLQIEQTEAEINLFIIQEKVDEFERLNPEVGNTTVRFKRTELFDTLSFRGSELNRIKVQIETLKDQIPILEVDLSAKQELGIIQAPLDLSSLQNLISNLTSQLGNIGIVQPETITVQQEPKDNTLRNLLIAAGVILVII